VFNSWGLYECDVEWWCCWLCRVHGLREYPCEYVDVGCLSEYLASVDF
jgi:hypothetical protein